MDDVDVAGFSFRSLDVLDTRGDDDDDDDDDDDGLVVHVVAVEAVIAAGDFFRFRGLDKLRALRGSVTCVDRDRCEYC
jgi:hypothetical protein